MMTGTLVFLVIGGVGVTILALGLIGSELASVVQADFDGAVSTEAVAGFIGVFGFGGAVASALLGPGGLLLSILIGLVAAAPAAFLITRLSRAAHDMPTDDTPQRSDLVGTLGVVVSPIPAGGYGEVRVQLGGHRFKLNARADQPITTGVWILVVEAPTDTSVVVVEAPGMHPSIADLQP